MMVEQADPPSVATHEEHSTPMDVSRLAKDSFYVTVGFGLLAFQRAQVARQDLRKAVTAQLGDARTNVERVSETVDERLKELEGRLEGLSEQLEAAYDSIEERVEKVLDDVEDRMPESARELLHSARQAAKEASGTLRELVGREGRAAA
jgi:DNA anti-recombination protein RmuC